MVWPWAEEVVAETTHGDLQLLVRLGEEKLVQGG